MSKTKRIKCPLCDSPRIHNNDRMDTFHCLTRVIHDDKTYQSPTCRIKELERVERIADKLYKAASSMLFEMDVEVGRRHGFAAAMEEYGQLSIPLDVYDKRHFQVENRSKASGIW